MKLYLLTRIKRAGTPTYDVANGFVVRAINEQDARALAAEQPGDEGRETWLNSKHSTCEILTTKADAGVVLRDFRAG